VLAGLRLLVSVTEVSFWSGGNHICQLDQATKKLGLLFPSSTGDAALTLSRVVVHHVQGTSTNV
jgi:hypothetical protein